jgi:hypothetical protein
MKRITLFSSLFALYSLHAADMGGEYSTWLGYLAVINAYGERTTLQGAGAGGEAMWLNRTDLIGAAAGAYSMNLTDCVGIGYHALRNAKEMSEVVAIGSGALSNRTGLTKATWINGHFAAFGQNNTFWLKANRNTPDTNAPIHYANGVLSFNADEVRINGATTGGTGGSISGGVSAPALAGYDLYIDCVNGDDSFDGTTPGTAKRTIEGAYMAVTNQDMTICLMPGVHLAPTNHLGGPKPGTYVYPEYRIHLIAPYGKDKTVIDGEGERGYWGCDYPFSSVVGCTLRNEGHRRGNRPAYFAIYFYDCEIQLSELSYPNAHPFQYCVFEKCRVSGTASVMRDDVQFSSMFMYSDVFDTVVDVSCTTNSGYLPNLSYHSYFENVYIRLAGGVHRFATWGSTTDSALGNNSAMNECTVICETAVKSFNVPPSMCCLFGLGDTTNSVPVYSSLEGCVCTNAVTVAALIQSDYRPPMREWRYRFAGYESAGDRSVKNSMENSIIGALLENDEINLTQTARMSLMRAVARNESIEAPRVVNRGTNSIPAGTAFQFHPDPDESPAID